MTKYKIGQKLRDKRFGKDYEVIEVFTRAVALKDEKHYAFIESVDMLDEHCTIIEDAPNRPFYCCIDVNEEGHWVRINECFASESEAEARLSEIKKQYNIE